MKITVLQENLQHTLQDLQKLVPARPSLPILSCLYFVVTEQKITLAATDLQVGIRAKIPGKVLAEGKAAVPAKVFFDLVTTLDAGELELSLEGVTLHVRSQDSTAQIQCFPPEDYPEFPAKEGEELTIPFSYFAPAVQATAFAAAVEDSRPVLTAVLVNLGEQLEMVATDGFRLSRITLPFQSTPRTMLLPARALNEVVRIAGKQNTENVVFTVSEQLKQAFFSFNDVEVLIRLMEGEFPPYQKILPVEFATQVVFDAQDLNQKMKTAQIFARDSSNIIRLQIEKDRMKITSSSSTMGKQESSFLVQVLQGGEQEFACNSKYLQDFLTVQKPTKVWMGLNESLKPVVFRPEENTSFQYVVMPFRVNQ